MPQLDTGIIVGAPPCQGFSRLNRYRKEFDDPRSEGIGLFARLVERIQELTPPIKWHAMLENVASMSEPARSAITQELEPVYAKLDVSYTTPYWVDAAILGHISRPRLYSPSWTPAAGEFIHKDSQMGLHSC